MHESKIPEIHQQRSEFIRRLVQRPQGDRFTGHHDDRGTPRTIVQFWHDLQHLPEDVDACIRTWAAWEHRGFTHCLFDASAAAGYITDTLGQRYRRAFERCYHPAMQADYFRLCYLSVEGGFYVDADDVCTGSEIEWLTEDGRLKLQPLCYDTSTDSMVQPNVFLNTDAFDPGWIFYFNNNPLIARPKHPVIERALDQSTHFLEIAADDELPEIQSSTGPGNLSRSVFELGATFGADIENDVYILRDWESLAVTQWPLSYRNDARNWRLSNQKRYV